MTKTIDEMLGGAIALAELLELVDKNAPSPLNIYKVAEEIKTTLTAVKERLESPELEERIAAEIRVQDIGQPSDLCAPHEYLDGSRVLAKATIKALRGE